MFGHAAAMGEARSAYRTLLEEPHDDRGGGGIGEKHSDIPKRGRVDGIGREGVHWRFLTF
jgi:hypothetical protein